MPTIVRARAVSLDDQPFTASSHLAAPRRELALDPFDRTTFNSHPASCNAPNAVIHCRLTLHMRPRPLMWSTPSPGLAVENRIDPHCFSWAVRTFGRAGFRPRRRPAAIGHPRRRSWCSPQGATRRKDKPASPTPSGDPGCMPQGATKASGREHGAHADLRPRPRAVTPQARGFSSRPPAPNPESPITNPQSQIPNPESPIYKASWGRRDRRSLPATHASLRACAGFLIMLWDYAAPPPRRARTWAPGPAPGLHSAESRGRPPQSGEHVDLPHHLHTLE
jgi:hypothetical protein